ncbi:MAG: bifunctional diguanylate cyclase/phosphodiesterase [Pseudomonadota bacterium]
MIKEAVAHSAAPNLSSVAVAQMPSEEDWLVQYEQTFESRDKWMALEEHYQYLLDMAPVAYITTSADGIVVLANQRALTMLDMQATQLIGMATVRLASANSRREMASHLARAQDGHETETELELRTATGTLPVLLRSVGVITDINGKELGVQSAIIDISLLKRTESKLRQAHDQLEVLAKHDTLTGLPNRTLLLDRLIATMESARRQHTAHALLFMDVDRFKVINDSLGHDIGDCLLQHIARCLNTAVRPNDTVARMGGDEFTVILQDVVNVENAENVARKILAAINEPVSLLGHRIRPSCSIGLCMFNGRTTSERELMRRADQAMYAAKQAGGNTVRAHDPNAPAHGFSELERDLHQACEQGQLRLYYQPQCDHDGRVIGNEALLRWQHPTRGLVAPSEFVPLAEQSGLICDVGGWVLEQACRTNVETARTTGQSIKRLAVNASLRELSSGGYAEVVARVLDETGHPGECLEIEITETALGLNEGLLQKTLEDLRDLGVSIALDDFGCGYSSFARLRTLPLSRLKIDRSFTLAIDESEGDRRIVAAIVCLGRELGLEVVAEGVETRSQLNFLQDAGCEVFQGFLLAQPAPAIAT